ncbi:hypothetical protein KNP414_07788 [Paenibacillus mucilaginosus KNP414]|uniref:Uncharacterized protein n=1 Tax=Paenibacillus mucilaginosus (strain KNP414) TaxID=1036673 RepID=F8FGX3_PAEMK|nr:hypothetical protein KNP414_07788 [Paenibacillus mucilaginosus KNP414]
MDFAYTGKARSGRFVLFLCLRAPIHPLIRNMADGGRGVSGGRSLLP